MIKNANCRPSTRFCRGNSSIFYERQIGCLPIISSGEIVGIVTRTDLLYTYVELTGAT